MAKTIEQLEGVVWPERGETRLVQRVERLRKKPTNQFTVDDLRTMVGQYVGVAHLMPRVLGIIEKSPFAPGDMYPGVLLWNVAQLPSAYWEQHPDHLLRFIRVAERVDEVLNRKAVRYRQSVLRRRMRGMSIDLDEEEIEESEVWSKVKAFLALRKAR